MRLLRRVMDMFRRPAAPPDPQLVTTRWRLDAAERKLARRIGVTVDQLRADYQRSDGVLGPRH